MVIADTESDEKATLILNEIPVFKPTPAEEPAATTKGKGKQTTRDDPSSSSKRARRA